VGPLDPVAFLGATGLLMAVAAVAADIPARRAAATDPCEALRAE
jgi:ABC-type lipoprotein release transport system permease subunit